MRIARVEVREYELPLVRAIRVGSAVLERRAGLVLLLEGMRGETGLGEIAPLPGLHAESLAEARAQILGVAATIEGTAIPAECAALAGACEAWIGDRGLLPSVRCGVEGAALALLASAAGTGLPELIAGLPVAAVHVNALLAGEPDALLVEARRLAAEGWRCLKIKVGRGNPAEEAATVAAVRDAVGPRLALRLDANRSWGLATAIDFARRAAPSRIEYLEEPLRDPADHALLAAEGSIPIALDETLLGRTPRDPGPLTSVAAFVIKPAVLGGYERAMAWVRCAAARGIAPVVSASFPAAVGLAADARFAAAAAPEIEHGLGTFAAFARDLAREPLRAPAGILELDRLPRRPDDLRLEDCRVLR